MVSLTVVGSCPKCGSPIYVESPWWGTTPPPSHYSCNCFRETQTFIWSNNTSDEK